MDTLALNQIGKSFGRFQAVQNLSFHVDHGQIYGLLGPNGAGKTTTIRMIMGIIMPDEGEIRLFDQPNTLKILDQVGYLPEERGLYKKMNVDEVIHFFGELKGMKKYDISPKMSYWLERFELTEWRDKRVEDLSRGMQQKLQFIITILHDPKIIILDEPFTGLDPVNTALVKDIILELKEKGTTIIFSTHLMEQVEKLCDSICLINKGRSVLQGNLYDIKQKYGFNRIQLQYEGDLDFLKREPDIEKLDNYGNYVEIRMKDGADSQLLLRRLTDNNTKIYRFELVEPSLNEIFIETVRKKE